MLGIGEFAGLTGLSVKALRHYDDKGVLVPVSVDEASGYRRYGEHQVRDGVMIRALRDAGVPLPDVAKVVVAGSAAETLAERRRAVEAQREREDAEFASAQAVLRGLAIPVDVVERDLPAQPFVGQIISLRADDAEALTDDDANAVFADLFARSFA